MSHFCLFSFWCLWVNLRLLPILIFLDEFFASFLRLLHCVRRFQLHLISVHWFRYLCLTTFVSGRFAMSWWSQFLSEVMLAFLRFGLLAFEPGRNFKLFSTTARFSFGIIFTSVPFQLRCFHRCTVKRCNFVQAKSCIFSCIFIKFVHFFLTLALLTLYWKC